MDAFLEKRGQNAISGWMLRCYRLQNCELIQYKKVVTDFKKCHSASIKHRYCILDVTKIFFSVEAPYVMHLTLRRGATPTTLHLRFPNTDHNLFCRWFRVLSSSMMLPSASLSLPTAFKNSSTHRPLPSTHCFALYYILRFLYQHEAMLTTPKLFQISLRQSSSERHVEALYRALIGETVNSGKRAGHLMEDRNYEDIHLLTMSLLYTLRNLPTSLLSDGRKWSAFICGVVDQLVLEHGESAKEKVSMLPKGMDLDIYVLWFDSKRKKHLAEIRLWILEQYQQQRAMDSNAGATVMDVLNDGNGNGDAVPKYVN